MLRNKIYYSIKPLIPRSLQIAIRRKIVKKKYYRCRDIWPIDPKSGAKPKNWKGWPGEKKFAFILTHDVDTKIGHDRVLDLVRIEEKLGFRSSFNFVPERYKVSKDLRDILVAKGFEVGVHGLKHDGKLYQSKKIFDERTKKINKYLKEWGSVGFRSPAMHHNLEWIQNLDIEYDASTFDSDPFEPQSDGVRTIFPFFVKMLKDRDGYVELPYTLPQDFTLYVLMQEKSIKIWKNKIDWIAQVGGMALLNTHPDYMNFDNKYNNREYSIDLYIEFLNLIKREYGGQMCHLLPKKLVRFIKKSVCSFNNSAEAM